MRYLICIFTLLSIGGIGNELSLIQPPHGWEKIHEIEQLPKKVLMIYVGSSSVNNHFTPTINIAQEKTTLPIKEYIIQAKQYHEGLGNTRCQLLGQLKTPSGPVEILQIDRPTQWGDMRFIQAMLIEGSDAYVVTATCLKEEFGALSSQIFKSIQSLSIAKTD